MRFIILFMVIPIVILTATFNQYEKSKTEIKSVSFIADSNIYPNRYSPDGKTQYEYICYEKYTPQPLIDSNGKEYLLRTNLDGTETIVYSDSPPERKNIVRCTPFGNLTLVAGDATQIPDLIDSYFAFHGYYTEYGRTVGVMTEEERERNLRNKGYVPKEASISPIIKPQLKKESKLVAGGKALISMTQYYLVYPDGLKIRIK